MLKMSNSVSAQIFLVLWTLIPGAADAVWIHAICVCVTKHNVLHFNCFCPFCDFNHHAVTSNNHPFLFSLKTCDAALQSLAVCACLSLTVLNADMFTALVHASIWSRNAIVRYNLFSLIACLAENQKSYFWPNFVCRKFGASLVIFTCQIGLVSISSSPIVRPALHHANFPL